METVAVVGLGYVGLPLAVEFGRITRTIGFDTSKYKVDRCRQGSDPSGELSDDAVRAARLLEYTTQAAPLGEADYIVIAVPTPVDKARIPDFRPLIEASRSAGRYMKKGAIVIYESTVYPGATEEVCIPALESESGMRWKEDFSVGYSPERINPGDPEHTLTGILKVVSGDTPETLEKIADLYSRIIKAGVFRAASIRTAEAAKVIENTQRDLNIALMNELAMIFNSLGIDTGDVLEAAGTKWNFLRFKPGLVGGHCIGVDPYYLTYKAQTFGYHPQVILAGRRINDGMGKYIAEQTIKRMIAVGGGVKGAKVNILGLAFKENCSDLRNSKVADIIAELRSYGAAIYVHDPHGDRRIAMEEYGVELTEWEELPTAKAIVAAVSHSEYLKMPIGDLTAKLEENGCFIDVKSAFDKTALEAEGISVWRL
ncbi:MAG: nucleotide sugar dehydrogenase [Helicobacteraceae bacterium]|nr:nucleotide sugar dehydrogenase [Helicobacteraceae bacterium]